MNVNADRLAQQVKLAYEFMEALHGQALALIKDVETQLAQSSQELRSLRPGGYRFTVPRLAYGLERPQPIIADYYAVYFRHFPGRIKSSPLDQSLAPIGLIKVVLRERGLEHPDVRFGIIVDVVKSPERGESQWPTKFEDLATHLAERVLTGSDWTGQGIVERSFEDSYVSLTLRGSGVRLADLPDSEAIALKIVDPLLAMYQEAQA